MTETAIGAVGLVSLFLFLALRMPVALAMMVVGFFGTIAINGLPAAMSTLGGEAFEISTTETLIVVPLFILICLSFALPALEGRRLRRHSSKKGMERYLESRVS